jgi:hypothetical protein
MHPEIALLNILLRSHKRPLTRFLGTLCAEVYNTTGINYGKFGLQDHRAFQKMVACLPSPLAPLPASGEGNRLLHSPSGGRKAGDEGVMSGEGVGDEGKLREVA